MSTNRFGAWECRSSLALFVLTASIVSCGGDATAEVERTPVVASAPSQQRTPQTPLTETPQAAPAPIATPEPAKVASAEPQVAAQQPKPAAPKPAPEKTVAPKPPQIPLMDLLTQRDLWPAKVALTQPLTIERGVTLPVGHELFLQEFNYTDLVLDTGTDLFEVAAEKTDVVERASALKASLTPEQVALNNNTLAIRSELWPLRVTLTRRVEFHNGTSLPIGREVTVRAVTTGGLTLYDPELADHFPVQAHETDVIARARERLALPEAQREPFFIRSIAAALEPSTTATDPNLAQTNFVLVYRARTDCPRCDAFAPELAKFYERVKPEHSGFETVFYSDDKTAENARAVFASKKLPGRAIAFDKRVEAANLEQQTGQLLPLVFLYDKSGNLITRNHPNGGKPSALDVLATLEAKLKEAR